VDISALILIQNLKKHEKDNKKHVLEDLTGKGNYVVVVKSDESGLTLKRINVLTFEAGLPGWGG